MIKDKYLEIFFNPPNSSDESSFLPRSTIVIFLKTFSDEQITKLGNSIFWLYPQKIFKQISNQRNKNIDYSFVDEFRREYNISNKYTIQEKIIGARLRKKL